MALDDFLSCDWGTTSFRLRWVRGAGHDVVREIRDQAGARSLYEEAGRSGAKTEEDRSRFFARFLRAKLEELSGTAKLRGRSIPLVISGMASSSIGWHELPYAKTPFALDGSGLRSQQIRWNGPDWLGATYLISGIATAHEMMRGEESEIVGLMSAPEMAVLRKRCLLILPGTHSKHVRIQNQSVTDFRTFMTGELFDVLGRHSILRASLELAANRDSISLSARAAFKEGVLWAKERGLAGGLFRVRTRAVLGGHPIANNTWFFSGLLIGAELADIGRDSKRCPVILAAAGAVAELYALAWKALELTKWKWIRVPPEKVARATVAAHALFLKTRAK